MFGTLVVTIFHALLCPHTMNFQHGFGAGLRALGMLFVLCNFPRALASAPLTRGHLDDADILREMERRGAQNAQLIKEKKELLDKMDLLAHRIKELEGGRGEASGEKSEKGSGKGWGRLLGSWWGEREEVVVVDGCTGIWCCVELGVELLKKSVVQVLDLVKDPITWGSERYEVLEKAVRGNFMVLSRAVGFLLAFVAVNLFSYLYLELEAVYTTVKEGVKLVGKLPIVVLCMRFCTSLLSTLKWTAKKEKVQGEKENQALQKMEEKISGLVEVIEELKKEIGARGRSSSPRPEPRTSRSLSPARRSSSPRAQRGRSPSPVGRRTPSPPPSPTIQRQQDVQCENCGKFGHSLLQCEEKRRCIWCGAYGHFLVECRKKMNGLPRTWPPKRVVARDIRAVELEKHDADCCSEISFAVSPPSLPSPPVVSIGEGKPLMHTPITIGERTISNCLIDTGAQVSVLPASSCIKWGIPYTRSEGEQVKLLGFNGVEEEAVGIATLSTKFGPSKEEKLINFVVSDKVSSAIVGLDALKAFGYTVDCSRGELKGEDGACVRCSVVRSISKN